MRTLSPTILLTGVVALTACSGDQSPAGLDAEGSAVFARSDRSGPVPFVMDAALQQEIEARLAQYVDQKAGAIETLRAEHELEVPDGVAVAPLGFFWTGYLNGETVGNAVFFFDRGNKQLPFQWVPGDPRRGGRNDIGYAIDDLGIFGNYNAPGVNAAQSVAAIDRAMATWEREPCSAGLTIPRGDFFEWLAFESDVFHEGFFPLPPGVLGVTTPFIFVDPATGIPTDIDSDGNLDYAFAVITYNSLFLWGIDSNVDVETVALHEMGHGLAQAHFGSAFVTLANNRVHFAPRSVMNAGYSGVQQSLTGTDRAGHCSLFGSWPNN